MKGFLWSCLLLFSGAMSVLAMGKTPTDTPKNEAPAHESKATIEGLVRDIACPIQNFEATATHLNLKCLRACAKAGSRLVILTEDGELYVPISDKMPRRRSTTEAHAVPGQIRTSEWHRIRTQRNARNCD